MFSSGLQVLYPLSLLFYLVLYWVYKTLLLKYYQRSSKFNERLALHSIRYLKWGVFFNLLVSTVIYTGDLVNSDQKRSDYSKSLDDIGLGFISSRIQQSHEQLQLALVLAATVCYILKGILHQLLTKVVLKLLSCHCCRKRNARLSIVRKDVGAKSDDIFKELQIS